MQNNSTEPAQKDISQIVAEKQAISLQHAYDSINMAKKLIKNGDLICRTGYDMVSRSLQNFNTQDKSFSHSGIAVVENGNIMVYHSIAGADENPDEDFMKEPFDSFVNPIRKSAFGIYRYKLSPEETTCLTATFKELEANHVKFDKLYNLKDDKEQYCSEAIYKALKNCTNNRVILPTSVKTNYRPKEPGYRHLGTIKKFEFVALDNLYLNTFCDSIFKVVYSTNPTLKH